VVLRSYEGFDTWKGCSPSFLKPASQPSTYAHCDFSLTRSINAEHRFDSRHSFEVSLHQRDTDRIRSLRNSFPCQRRKKKTEKTLAKPRK
jgi:hypothetical protein